MKYSRRESKLHIGTACNAVVERVAQKWFFTKFRRKPKNKTELMFAFNYWVN